MDDNLSDWLLKTIDEIKIENGLDPTAKGIVCVQCRKMVQCENGLLFCECHDERKGIDPNAPGVVPIDLIDMEEN